MIRHIRGHSNLGICCCFLQANAVKESTKKFNLSWLIFKGQLKVNGEDSLGRSENIKTIWHFQIDEIARKILVKKILFVAIYQFIKIVCRKDRNLFEKNIYTVYIFFKAALKVEWRSPQQPMDILFIL